jgi:YVTN family beta-propeller protein
MRISLPLPVLVLALTFAVPAVAADGFVGCSNSDDCFPFDPVTYVSGVAIDLLPEGNYPYDATISPDGGQVWFTGASGDGVVVIDRATSSVIQQFAVANYCIGVAFNLDGSRALVTSRDDEVIKIIDTATYAEVGSLPFPTDYQGPGNIAIDPRSGSFYVVDWYNDYLVEVAADGSGILRSADFGNSLWQVVVAPDGQHVYVTDRGLDQVVEIDTTTFTVTRSFHVGDDPWGLDISGAGDLLVVVCEDSHEVILIDLVSGDTTPIALDATADARDVDILDTDGVAFVTGGSVTGYSAAVYVIDLESATIIDTFDGPGGNSNVVAVQAQMVGDPSVVETETVPVIVASLTVYPNPFNPQVNIALALDHQTSGVLSVFDLAGRRIQNLASGVFEAGERTYSWNGRDESGRNLPSGVYLVRLHGEDIDLFHKIVLMQ